MTPNSFQKDVLVLVDQIPKGRVVTYKQLAHMLGSRAYRFVGQCVKKNPHLGKVPCHRVVCSDGSLGGYVLGVDQKKKLLESEGIVFLKNGKIDLDVYEFMFAKINQT
ncbi:MAG: MGMT family protein [Candidatus Woesearchaeota archaeon]